MPVGKMSDLHRNTVDVLARAGMNTTPMWRLVPLIMGIEWTETPARWIPDAWMIELLDKRLVVIEVIVTSELWGRAKRARIRAWNEWLIDEGWKLQLWTLRPSPDGATHNWTSLDPEDFLPDDLHADRWAARLRGDDPEFLL